MLQPKLKEATSQQHTELEQLMFVDEIINKTLTNAQYKKLLATNYIVHQQLEPKIVSLLNESSKRQITLDRRLKSEALADDLDEIGLNTELLAEEFEHLGDFIDSEQKALGALYVLEGSSIGGLMIYKKLIANENISKALNFKFYNHYGEQTMPLWKDFVSFLNEQPETAENDAIMGAIKTFDAIKNVAKSVKKLQLSDLQVVPNI